MTLYLKHPPNADVLKCLGAVELSLQSPVIHSVTGEEAHLARLGLTKVLEYSGVVYVKEDGGGILWDTNAILGFFCGADDEQYRFLQWISSELKPAVAQLGRATVDLPVELLGLLDSIDQRCSPYIFGAKVTAVDLSAFLELKAFFGDPNVATMLGKKCPQLTAWNERMEKQDIWKKGDLCCPPPAGKKSEPNVAKAQKSKVDEKKAKPARKQDSRQASADRSKGAAKSSPQPLETPAAEEDHVVVDAAEIAEAAKTWREGPASLRKPFKPVHPVLPCEDGSQRNVLVTSALPYVNNVPHLGNIVGCVLSADVFARFCRLRGYRTLYVCGTDEYGTATETKALEMGLTPKEVCDKFNAIHSRVYSWFNIEFDHFGRTTTNEQTEIAQNIFWDLHANGHLLEDAMEQLHCEQCDRFLADRFVEGTCPKCGYEDARGDQCDKCGQLMNAVELIEAKCKICRSAPKIRSSKHLFLDLPKLEGKLSDWMDGVCEDWTPNARVIAKSWIKDGLKPRCITRDLKWGTPVPMEGYTDKVFYVWYDAPIGYPSITKCYTPEWQKWWMNPKNVELFMFMGKDNVPFHAVIFPSCLLGTGREWTVVNRLCATEYLNYEDGKFSKSRGQGVFGDEAEELGLPADLWRFYLLAVRPESQDSVFNWVDMQTRANSELLNNLGNFINRVLSFLEKSFDSTVPEVAVGEDGGNIAKENAVVAARVQKLLTKFVDLFERVKLRDALRVVMAVSKIGNQHMQASKPWVLIKGDDKEKAEAGSLIGFCTNIVCLLGAMLHPFMPATAKEIFSQLNAPEDLMSIEGKFTCFIEAGHKIGKPSPLFQKIESSAIEDYKKRFAGKEASPAATGATKGAGDAKKASSKPNVAVANGASADPELVARLTEDITKQGNVVRDLKTKKAEKSAIDVEVAKLLALKKQLAGAQGVDSAAAAAAAAAAEGDSKKKGGKKKVKK